MGIHKYTRSQRVFLFHGYGDPFILLLECEQNFVFAQKIKQIQLPQDTAINIYIHHIPNEVFEQKLVCE